MKEFEGNFECLGESTEKYITFSVPIKKKIKNKDLEITYKIKFIDSYIFMASSLSKLNYDMLLMVEEGIRGRICHSIHRYAKANNKYMKNYNNNEELSFIQYSDTNNPAGTRSPRDVP